LNENSAIVDPLQNSLREVVYCPDSSLQSPGKMFAAIWHDIVLSRDLAWRMFVRDIKGAYRQSFFGYAWILLPPIASMLMFGFLQRHHVLNVGHTDIPYPAFVLTGTLLWEAFAGAIGAPMAAVGGASAMLTRLNFPRESLLLTAAYHIFFTLGIKFLLLIPVYVIFQVPLHPSLLAGPLVVLALVLLGFSAGLWLVPLGLLYQDVGRILGLALGIGFLITPVVYPPPAAGLGRLLNSLNPVAPLLTTGRELLAGQPLSQLAAACVITGLSLIVFLLGLALYRIAMPHLVARMSA
jgi:lipopolysaccharide transport system permease protein